MSDTEPEFFDIVGTDVKPSPELGGTLIGDMSCCICGKSEMHGHTQEEIDQHDDYMRELAGVEEYDHQTSGAYS